MPHIDLPSPLENVREEVLYSQSSAQRHKIELRQSNDGTNTLGRPLSGGYPPRFPPPITTVSAEGHPPNVSMNPSSSPFPYGQGLALPVLRFTDSIVHCVTSTDAKTLPRPLL